MEKLLEENQKLKERVAFLESILNRGNSGNTNAYHAIRLMIIEKVQKEVDVPEYLADWQKKDTRSRAERQIMRDLKWDLRVRTIADFKSEHTRKAKEYINNYVLPEDLKKSRWEDFK